MRFPTPSSRRTKIDDAPVHVATPDTLMAAVKFGDEAAFAQLYDQMAATVFGLAKRVLRDPAQAEEVAQEVFLEIWRKAPSYDDTRGSARGWIVTMTHRRAVDRVRSSQAARRRDDNASTDASTHQGPEVDVAVVTNLESERVRRALGQLTEAQRQAITLAFYDGHTYRQVAEILEIAEGTAKTRIRDGLIRLRHLLEVS